VEQDNEKPGLTVVLFCGFIGVMFVLLWILPKADISPRERRALESFPQMGAAALLDGSYEKNIERYISDHFPFRQAWLWIDAHYNLYTGRNGFNGIYKGKEGSLIDGPVRLDESRLDANMDEIRAFAQSVDPPVAMMAVPSAGFIMKHQLPVHHEPYLDDMILTQARERLTPAVQWIDLREPFETNARSAQLYYKTDHHWTSRGAYVAYQAFARARGFSPIPEDRFDIDVSEGFYGTTYAKSCLWETPPDTIELWRYPADIRVEIRDVRQEETAWGDSFFFKNRLSGADPYAVFLDGNHSWVKITNENVAAGRLLMVKDSFAHCLAPFLAGHYREIHLIDLRYYQNSTVTEWLAANQADEILFVYGIDALVNDTNFIWLNAPNNSTRSSSARPLQ
jgi:hypothetical protein